MAKAKILIDDIHLKDAHLNGHKVICLDTETTGLTAEDEVIQFSGIVFNGDTYAFEEECSFYINIGRPLPQIITNLTGITDDTLNTQGIPREEAYARIKEFIGDNVIMGYNVTFDIKKINHLYNMFNDEFKPATVIDIFKIVKKYCDKGETENQKLGTMASYFKCDEGLSYHNAIDDVIATIRLAKALYDQRISVDNFNTGEVPLKNFKAKEENKVLPSYPNFPPKVEGKEKVQVIKLARWGKSTKIDRVYITVKFMDGNSGQLYFDNLKSCYTATEEHAELLDRIDLYDMQIQIIDKLLAEDCFSFLDVK